MILSSDPNSAFKNPQVVLPASMLFGLIHSNSSGSIYEQQWRASVVGWFGEYVEDYMVEVSIGGKKEGKEMR